jgi:cardiolipin synthase
MSWAILYFISEWVIRVIMLLYVPRRRSPSAARTWLLLIFLFPWPGLLMYAALGRPHLSKRRVELQMEVSDLIRTARSLWEEHTTEVSDKLRPELRQAARLAANLGDFGVCGSNDFELLVDYSRSIERVVTDIESARHHIHLLYYIFADDSTGRRVFEALGHAAQRGVKCRVLMDGIGSRTALRTLAPAMRASGIEVQALLPVGLLRKNRARFDMRNHRKISVIDGSVGYFGSQNIVAPDSTKDCSNEELVVRVTGPLVAQLQAVFLMDWYLETEESLGDPDLFPEPHGAGTSPAQILPSGPTYPSENAHAIMVALMHGARERILITTPYFIPDEPFLQAMHAAVQRGIEVHLVVSRQCDHILVGLAQKSYYDELLGMSVHIHLYERAFLHAKHLSIDDCVALIGSSNMDIRSFLLNSEVSVLIYDSGVVAKLRQVQERYFMHSHLLTQEEWDRRPIQAQLLQNIARLADSFL